VWNNYNRKDLKYLEGYLRNAIFSTTKPTWTALGFNIVVCGKRLEFNQMGYDIDVDLSGISLMGINSNVVSQY